MQYASRGDRARAPADPGAADVNRSGHEFERFLNPRQADRRRPTSTSTSRSASASCSDVVVGKDGHDYGHRRDRRTHAMRPTASTSKSRRT